MADKCKHVLHQLILLGIIFYPTEHVENNYKTQIIEAKARFNSKAACTSEDFDYLPVSNTTLFS